MQTKESARFAKLRVSAAVFLLLFLVASCAAQEMTVATSGAFTAAYKDIVPQFEQAKSIKVMSEFGPSMGNTPQAIPNRLKHGEAIDLVILARPALDDLVKRGKVEANSEVDVVQSKIGMVVRAGAPKPDISTLEGLKQTFLRAKSIAYSDSASGVYISTELFQKLGIADQVSGKSKKIEGEMVGPVVARGDAEIGFQQISELLPEPGVELVGPLPSGAQRVTVFSAGVVVGCKHPDAARALITFFASPTAVAAMRKSGLEPVLQN